MVKFAPARTLVPTWFLFTPSQILLSSSSLCLRVSIFQTSIILYILRRGNCEVRMRCALDPVCCVSGRSATTSYFVWADFSGAVLHTSCVSPQSLGRSLQLPWREASSSRTQRSLSVAATRSHSSQTWLVSLSLPDHGQLRWASCHLFMFSLIWLQTSVTTAWVALSDDVCS